MTAEILPLLELQRLVAAAPAPIEPMPITDSPLLRLLASLERDLLATLMTERHCTAGEVIFREGASGDAMYLIWAGRVGVFKGNLQSPTVLGYRGPGEVIGEMALLEEQPRSASVIALENTRLLRIDRETFQEWLNSNPAVGMSIMASLSARLRSSDNILNASTQAKRQLVRKMSELQSEKERLQELQRVRQETSDLVIHDLRNPLSIIYGVLSMLEMVLPKDSLENNRELLNMAHSSAARMQRLIDSLLDIAKLETDEFPLNVMSTNLRALVEDAVKREAFPAQLANVTLETVIPSDLPAVVIDPDKIDRVLMNLIDNAIKYSPKDAPITVSLDYQQDCVTVSVTDRGRGIPPEERERIFERFAQVPGDRPRGFGLGLTFCYLAVAAHGGQIWVEPGPDGVGSSFMFTLPL